MDKKLDVIVSEEVYWALVKRKFTDQYRSIDEVLRPMLGICPGARARTRSYEREMEYMIKGGGHASSGSLSTLS